MAANENEPFAKTVIVNGQKTRVYRDKETEDRVREYIRGTLIEAASIPPEGWIRYEPINLADNLAARPNSRPDFFVSGKTAEECADTAQYAPDATHER